MKRKHFSYAFILSAAFFTACNNDSTSSSTTTDTATTTTTNNTNMSDTSGSMNYMSNMSLSDMDRQFIMKAAKGGMMEVESSNITQQNGQNQRVKDLATMIMRDHTNANAELRGLASSKGLTIPEDSLMASNKPHLDEMRNMKGASLDKHYVNMMLNDHNKDIAEFEKAANGATDADLKAWAAKTLPTLRMHKDSTQAVNKIKM